MVTKPPSGNVDYGLAWFGKCAKNLHTHTLTHWWSYSPVISVSSRVLWNEEFVQNDTHWAHVSADAAWTSKETKAYYYYSFLKGALHPFYTWISFCLCSRRTTRPENSWIMSSLSLRSFPYLNVEIITCMCHKNLFKHRIRTRCFSYCRFRHELTHNPRAAHLCFSRSCCFRLRFDVLIPPILSGAVLLPHAVHSVMHEQELVHSAMRDYLHTQEIAAIKHLEATRRSWATR